MSKRLVFVFLASLALLRPGIAGAATSADIVVNLEQPRPASIYSGVATIRGWAVSPRGMERVELYVDDQFRREIPMGGGRLDVCSNPDYPEDLYPGACNSGFSSAFNYSNLAAGSHSVTVIAYDLAGDHNEARAEFDTVRFRDAFLPDPGSIDLTRASAIEVLDANTLRVRGLGVDGEPADVTLGWRTGSQDFDIQGIVYQGATAVPYGFEALAANQMIDGQDGWVDQAGQGDAVVRIDGTAENGTKVAAHLATTAFNQSAFLTRTNNAGYSFPPVAPDQPELVLEFDLTGDHIATFALGRDLNGNGYLEADPFSDGSGSEIGPVFGIDNSRFLIQEAGFGTEHAVPWPSGNAVWHWYRLKLVADLAADGGAGVGTLYYRNLTRGDVDYRTVPGLSGIGLGLDGLHASAGPARWNAMWVHLLTGGGNSPSVDNLFPNAGAAP